MMTEHYPFAKVKILVLLVLSILHQLEGVYTGIDEDFGITEDDFIQEVNGRAIYTFSCIIRDDFEIPIDALETMLFDYASVSIIHPVVVSYTVEHELNKRNFTRLTVRISCI